MVHRRDISAGSGNSTPSVGSESETTQAKLGEIYIYFMKLSKADISLIRRKEPPGSLYFTVMRVNLIIDGWGPDRLTDYLSIKFSLAWRMIVVNAKLLQGLFVNISMSLNVITPEN